MRNIVTQLCHDESGATAIEYGLICALIAMAAIGAMQSFSTSTITMWMTISGRAMDASNKANSG